MELKLLPYYILSTEKFSDLGLLVFRKVKIGMPGIFSSSLCGGQILSQLGFLERMWYYIGEKFPPTRDASVSGNQGWYILVTFQLASPCNLVPTGYQIQEAECGPR